MMHIWVSIDGYDYQKRWRKKINGKKRSRIEYLLRCLIQIPDHDSLFWSCHFWFYVIWNSGSIIFMSVSFRSRLQFKVSQENRSSMLDSIMYASDKKQALDYLWFEEIDLVLDRIYFVFIIILSFSFNGNSKIARPSVTLSYLNVMMQTLIKNSILLKISWLLLRGRDRKSTFVELYDCDHFGLIWITYLRHPSLELIILFFCVTIVFSLTCRDIHIIYIYIYLYLYGLCLLRFAREIRLYYIFRDARTSEICLSLMSRQTGHNWRRAGGEESARSQYQLTSDSL